MAGQANGLTRPLTPWDARGRRRGVVDAQAPVGAVVVLLLAAAHDLREGQPSSRSWGFCSAALAGLAPALAAFVEWLQHDKRLVTRPPPMLVIALVPTPVEPVVVDVHPRHWFPALPAPPLRHCCHRTKPRLADLSSDTSNLLPHPKQLAPLAGALRCGQPADAAGVAAG